ncbi:MAG: thiamine-phosphate kinase [Candidatus Omnitrophica bacterium]|nr:thiamine-phosphate kinase [Candidatus Omnitrophota bacterium]MDD5653226.1 thiamine-phosphate kinase [Candidatus Omnitrophota bacterium]
MQIKDIGEFGLIERFARKIKNSRSVIVGSGDDCAVLTFNRQYYQLFTCDMLIEGVDFLSSANPYLVGRKAIAVSLSDIAACAGKPMHAVISLGVPKKSTLKYCDRLFKGMNDIAKQYGVNIVGGDISHSEKTVIDVSMLGLVEKKYLVLRSGAKKGDIIFVSGCLGGSILDKHLKFTPRLKEARFLVENFKIHSMIDISDGLLADLGHILKASGTGGLIFAPRVPISKVASGLNDALASGEDFELLFTVSPVEANRFFSDKRAKNFQAIGEIIEKKQGLKLINQSGKEIKISGKGYQHF